jgi:predicted hydrocarbon binding protein
MEREADKNLPELSWLVDDKLAALREIEEKEIASIDVPADVFGDMMASLLSYGLDGDKKLVASNIGKRIGRWIYIVDAFDDYDKDRKSGSYNPFVLLYDAENFSEDNLISISKMLEAELALALSAIDLLDEDSDKTRSEIIKNILCLGMPQSVKKVCDKHRKAENK